jgi:molybdenum-dependent DNA-binding transcriptional regulator ModE
VHGGGAQLTAQGHDLVKKFRAFERGLGDEIEQRFADAFNSQAPGV